MSANEIQSCEEALRHLAAHIDRELSPSLESQMEDHLEVCRSCYSRAEFEKRLKENMAALNRAPVRPELTDRVQTLIRDFTVAGGE